NFGEYDFGSGPSLLVAGSFNTVSSTVGAGLLTAWTPSRPSVAVSQATTGSVAYLVDSNLVAGREYFNVITGETCPGGPGTGPYLGLCASDPQLLISEVQAPLGALPFHFAAT